MSTLQQRLAKLSPEQRAALVKKLKQQSQAQPKDPGIPVLPRDKAGYALSNAQQRMWFFQQMDEANTTYNMSSALSVKGNLNIKALNQSLTDLVARHESLRMVFTEIDSEVMQKILKPMDFAVRQEDLSGLDEAARELEVKQRIDALATYQFDLRKGPLMDVQLLKLAQHEYLLLANLHHIISDGWSMTILIQELSVLYQSHLDGKSAQLPALGCQYVDFSAWQKEALSDKVVNKQLLYWKNKMAGAPELFEVPGDHPRPAVIEAAGRTVFFDLPQSLVDKINQFGQSKGMTQYMVLLCAFNVLLAKYSGQQDLVIGTPTANRNRGELEKIIGFFANTIALRCEFSRSDNFLSALNKVKNTVLSAHKHQDVPFDQVVEHLSPKRSLSYAPLFQVMFVLQNVPSSGALKLGDLTIENLEVERVSTDFDLIMELCPTDEGLHGILNYRTCLYEQRTMDSFIEHYRYLLEALLLAPEAPLLSVGLPKAETSWQALELEDLPSREDKQWLNMLARNPYRYDVPGNSELSKADLVNRVLNMAGYFAEHTQAGQTVGLLLDCPERMVLATLAAWQAGLVVTPINANDCDIGTKVQLKQTQSVMMVTDREIGWTLVEVECVKFDETDYQGKAIEARSLAPDDLALSIFAPDQIIHWRHKDIHSGVNSLHIAASDRIVVAKRTGTSEFVLDALWALTTTTPVTLVNPCRLAEVEVSPGSSVALLLASPCLGQVPVETRNRTIYLSASEPDIELVSPLLDSETEVVWQLTNQYFAKVLVHAKLQKSALGHPQYVMQGCASELQLLDSQLQPVAYGLKGHFYLPVSDLLACSGEFEHNRVATGINGRITSDGELVVDFNAQTLWRRGFVYDDKQLASIVKKHSKITDMVTRRYSYNGDTLIVSFVVCKTFDTVNGLAQSIADKLHWAVIPDVFVPVKQIPLLPSGEVNWSLLADSPALSDALLERFDAELNQTSGVVEAKTLVLEQKQQLSRIHLSDLIPGWQRNAGEQQLSTASDEESATADEDKPLSLLDGGDKVDKKFDQLSDILYHAAKDGDKGIHYIPRTGDPVFKSYKEILQSAKRHAGGMVEKGLKPGDKVLFLTAHNELLVPALWGCILAGGVPVPLTPIKSYTTESTELAKLVNACTLLDPHLLIIDQSDRKDVKALLKDKNLKVKQVMTAPELCLDSDDFTPAKREDDDIALMMLTSGSTGMPKAVVQTHFALLSQISANCAHFGFDQKEVSLNWMPLDHVAGIVMFHMRDIFSACDQVLVATDRVLADPLLWTEYMSQYKASITWAPNFAYALVNERKAQFEDYDWDLSSMRCIFNGAESIVRKTSVDFLSNLAPYGLKDTTMIHGWGMSETSSGVLFTQFDAEVEADYVEIGTPIPGVQVRVVDEHEQLVAEGKTGRLQVLADCVTQGYYQNSEATDESFTKDGWFNTGDLAMVINGQMIMTGREKDVIIINGKNFYGHEIEQVVDDTGLVKASFTAACPIREPGVQTDRVAVFFVLNDSVLEGEELEAEKAQAIDTIREALVAQINISPSYLVPVTEQDIPKTSIGKIMRAALSSEFLNGKFDALIKSQDLQLGNNNTLEQWFSRPDWVRCDLHMDKLSLNAVRRVHDVVVFSRGEQDNGFIRQLTAHPKAGTVHTIVEHHSSDAENGYSLNGSFCGNLHETLQSLAETADNVDKVVYLWDNDQQSGDLDKDKQTLQQHSLNLFSALSALGETSLQLFMVAIIEHHPDNMAGAALAGLYSGLAATIPLERPWCSTTLVELELDCSVNEKVLLEEVLYGGDADFVRYHHEQRQIRRLKALTMQHYGNEGLKVGGRYLVTGALGGIGQYVSGQLLGQYGAQLMLVGRSELSGDKAASVAKWQKAHSADKVAYHQADITDMAALEAAVKTQEDAWGEPLDGIFHLAGDSGIPSDAAQDRTLNCNLPDYFHRSTSAKVEGTANLGQIAIKRRNSLFVAFSSVNALFGGATYGAYASANSYLDRYCEAMLEETDVRCYGINWSMWDDLGMSEGFNQGATLAMGYRIITPEAGWASLRALLHCEPGRYAIGIDPYNINMMAQFDHEDVTRAKVVSFVCPDVPTAAPELCAVSGKSLSPHWVALEALPKLENGELDLNALSALGEAAMQSGDFAQPGNDVEQALLDIWCQLLGKNTISINDNFFQVGGDSILSTQVIAKAKQLGIIISAQQMFEYQTIAEMAEVVSFETLCGEDQEKLTGDCPLSAIQSWFVELDFNFPHHWNQSLLLKFNKGRLSQDALQQALLALAHHHDVLRLRTSTDNGTWQQHFIDEVAVTVRLFDYENMSEDEAAATLKEMATTMQGELSLNDGPLMQAGAFLLPGGEQRILLAVHHWATDGITWRILLEDLADFYTQAVESGKSFEDFDYPYKSSSYRKWTERCIEQANKGVYDGDMAYWQDVLKDNPQLPFAKGDNLKDSEIIYEDLLGAQDTSKLITDVLNVLNVEINEVLLTALQLTFNEWSDQDRLLLSLEGHGRDGDNGNLDISRTCGWFTSIYPVVLPMPKHGNDIWQTLKQTKQALRSIPNKGLSYGRLSQLKDNREFNQWCRQAQKPQISFNYLGQFDATVSERDSLLSIADEPMGPMQNPGEKRVHAVDVVCFVVGGELKVGWAYSTDVISTAQIERMSQRFLALLSEIVVLSQAEPDPVLVLADYPLLKCDETEFEAIVAEAAEIVDKRNLENLYPVASIQHGLLYHSMLAPGEGVYVSQLMNQLSGPLDKDCFQKAWQMTIERHEVYRSAFIRLAEGTPCTVVAKDIELNWRYFDWSGLSQSEIDSRYDKLLLDDRIEGYKLEAAPLLRIILIKLGPQLHRFVLSEHHAISDGWSRTVVLTEVLTHYEALVAGQKPKLPGAQPFSQYLLWQQAQDNTKALDYWRNELKGVQSATNFSVDKTKGTDQAFVPRVFERHVDLDATARVKAFAKAHSYTLNIVVQSAWALLLSRYSNELDVVFGATVSGRPLGLSGSASMVGPFINSLPVRIELSHQTKVSDLLALMLSKQLSREPHEFVALSEIQNCCDIPAGQPLFESLMVFENYPIVDSEQSKGELKVDWSSALDQTELPMTILIDPADEMGILVYYDGARFDDVVIERMMVHLEMLMLSFCEGAERTMGQQTMLTEDEVHKVYHEWNQPQVEFGTEHLMLHELFSDAAHQYQDNVAVIYDGGELTYRQTYNRSVALAEHIVEKHAPKPNKLIAIVLEKGWEHVVATYAIMYSGGAYLPIDPLWPEDRRDYLIEYGEVDVVLTSAKLAKEYHWPDNVTLILVDDYQDDGEGLLPVPKNRQVLTDLAYVIFTSGSTGKPKGVMIDHRGAVNTCIDINRTYDVDESDRILAVSSLTFDLSVYDIFGLLAAGGAVVMPTDEQAKDPAAWSKLVEQHKVTLWDTVPALMLLFVEHQERNDIVSPHTIRVTMMSGDWIPTTLPNRIRNQFPASKVISMGGATEASIWSIRYPIETVDPSWISIPYGKAMTNQSFFVFNENFEPCPVGVQGPMYIGGVGVAKGYWRDDEKTNASFIRHPHNGQYLYSTGDLGRYREDGNIEFLGRSDFQIKLNGYRIELGEIQTALSKHPQVDEAVVMVREDEPGERRLVAYYIAEYGSDALKTDEIREFLRKLIPEYMVPWQYMKMEHFPLSSNGKVDLKQLPAPAKTAKTSGSVQLSDVESILLAIWSDVLDNRNLQLDDNFFEMGGHSLLTAQVIARVRGAFNIDLPIRALFTAPTIRTLAEQVEQVKAQDRVSLPAVAKADAAEMALSSAQSRLWFLDQLEGQSNTYNITQALTLTGKVEPQHLSKALEVIVNRHEVLRTTFVHEQGVPRQEIAQSHQVELDAVEVDADDVMALIDEEARFSFDLATGPLYRFCLSKQTADTYTLIITIHHIISDGWSMAMFMQELTELYNAYVKGEQPNLPELEYSYRDYAKWERMVDDNNLLENQMVYWQDRLNGMPTLLTLPTDKPRPEVQTFGGANIGFELDKALFDKVQRYANAQGITLYMHLLSTLSLVLHLESGQDDVAVGTTVANRTLAEFESIMGFFANQIVMRASLADNPTFKQLTEQMRTVALDAYSNQNLPFEQLVDKLLPERTLAHTPLFQVKLVLQNVPVEAGTVGDCKVEVIPIDPGTSKFDLQFTMDETADSLSGILTYNTDIFEPGTAQRLIDLWIKVMTATADSPDSTVTALKAQLAASSAPSNDEAIAKNASLSLGKLKSRRRRAAKPGA